MKNLIWPMLALSACLLSLAGCGSSQPTRFYVLSTLPERQPVGAAEELSVGVGPVELPEYLDRPQIVTRSGQNELNLAEFERWGASLKDNVTEVLADNLAVLLPSKKIATYPWRRSTLVAYQVAVKVTRFDRTEGGEAVLSARWKIMNAEGSELLIRESHYAENPADKTYAATVAAMNRVLAQFSREVAVAINGLKGGLPVI
jgi:uncharacterized lipoprotein YmbA